jgi:predicted RNase H-like nuclease (RuvC/YqgF family)
MDQLKAILTKNKFHILVLKAKEQSKTKKQLESLKILTETLEYINELHNYTEALEYEIRQLKAQNSKLMLDNAILKKEVKELKQFLDE